MPTSYTGRLRGTKSPDEFESLCRDILIKQYNKSSSPFEDTFSRLGCSGQRQDGIDIYCDLDNGKRIVAQCKNYDPRKPPTHRILLDTIVEDIELANTAFTVDTFVVMTALKRDSYIEKFVSTLNATKKYAFPIRFLFWDDIETILFDNSNRELLEKYDPELFSRADRTDEVLSAIEKLQEQVSLGFKFKTTVKNDDATKVKERLDNALRTLAFACELNVGADTAQRVVNRFISSFNELGDITKYDALDEIIEECFEIALRVEANYDLDFSAHRRYLEYLNARHKASKAIDVEERIIKKLEKDTSPYSLEVAKAYGRLAAKCLHVSHCTCKGFLAIKSGLSCWENLAETRLSDEETIELSRFMDTVAQFFAFDAEPYINSKENRISEDHSDWFFLSDIQVQMIGVVALIVKNGRCFINFNEIGFPKMYEMLDNSNSFGFHIRQVYDKIEQGDKTLVLYPVDNGIFVAEFYALTSFALIAGLLVNSVTVPHGDIATTINTTALIAGWEKRVEIQKELYLEAIRHIENQENSKKQSFSLSLAYHNFGQFALEQDDPAIAEIYFTMSLDEEKKRAQEYNEFTNKTLALAHISLAHLFATEKKNLESIQQYEEAKAVFELIEKSDIDPETYNREYARCLIALAEQYRMSWIIEAREIGFYSLDNANKSISALQKALDICQEKYESAIDVYGSLLVDLDIEIAQNYAWFQEDYQDKTTTDVFVEKAIEVCEDMMLRKSDAYYGAFKKIISYLYYTVDITPQLTDREVIERNLSRGQKYFENILTFLENKIENKEICPTILYPSWVHQRTDFILCSDGSFFEWLSRFETVYFMCASNLCSIYVRRDNVKKAKELCQKAKVFATHLENNVSIFLYEEEMRKIEKLEIELITRDESDDE
ncbi:MAG: hypothetical protein FWC43_00355 [Planctomycetaceae bacterium]|nr:hypothetical protein [Planctomycetaceae bacterium]